MGTIILGITVSIVALRSLITPWVGLLGYYLFALMAPHNIWWWIFDGMRVSFIISCATLAGLAFRGLQGRIDLSFAKTPISLLLLLLWLSLVNSYFSGIYVSSFKHVGVNPELLFSLTNTMFLFYFCGVLTLNESDKIKWAVFMFAAITCYLTYWANAQYLSGNWNQFNGTRLMGPINVRGGSIYKDENIFAMIFVTGLPFLYCVGQVARRRWLRYAAWSVIPFAFHAVFLTGSRGGLLGLVVITAMFLYRRRSWKLALPLALFLALFYQFQAGSAMLSRSQTIAGYEEDSSAQQRLTAWKGGLEMVKAHPVSGVGLGSFVTALPVFTESRPLVAHNTLVQYSAESGLGAGLCFFLIALTVYRNSRSIDRFCREHEADDRIPLLRSFNDATIISFAGFIVCSLFLSLNTCEVFFFLLIINNSLSVLCRQSEAALSAEWSRPAEVAS